MEELYLVVLGALLPPVIDLVNRFIPNSSLRFIASLVICLTLGSILAFLTSGVEGILADGTIVFAMSQVVYKLWYEKSQLQTKIRGDVGTAE
jgi:uncharacterized membrane protein required for colicin V production